MSARHRLTQMRVVSVSFALYRCSCGLLGYATVSRNLAHKGASERAAIRNHHEHAKRAA